MLNIFILLLNILNTFQLKHFDFMRSVEDYDCFHSENSFKDICGRLIFLSWGKCLNLNSGLFRPKAWKANTVTKGNQNLNFSEALECVICYMFPERKNKFHYDFLLFIIRTTIIIIKTIRQNKWLKVIQMLKTLKSCEISSFMR